jgi:hypothetical protein
LMTNFCHIPEWKWFCSTVRSKLLEISKVLLSQDLFKLFCFSTFATSWGKLFVSQLGLCVSWAF